MKILLSHWSSDLGLLRDNHLSGFFKRRAAFVKVTDEEISKFNENTVLESKKRSKNGVKLLRDKKYVEERRLTLFCVKIVLYGLP